MLALNVRNVFFRKLVKPKTTHLDFRLINPDKKSEIKSLLTVFNRSLKPTQKTLTCKSIPPGKWPILTVADPFLPRGLITNDGNKNHIITLSGYHLFYFKKGLFFPIRFYRFLTKRILPLALKIIRDYFSLNTYGCDRLFFWTIIGVKN